MSEAPTTWRWVGEDGTQHAIDQDKLVGKLSAESLPAYTLLWRPGWAEWLPAMQVAELAWALPAGKADTPVTAKDRPGSSQPPTPPLYRYPVIKRRAAAIAKGDRPGPARYESGPFTPIPPEREPGWAAHDAPVLEVTPGTYADVADDIETRVMGERPPQPPTPAPEDAGVQPLYVAPHAPPRAAAPAPEEHDTTLATQPLSTPPPEADAPATSPIASPTPLHPGRPTLGVALAATALLVAVAATIVIVAKREEEPTVVSGAAPTSEPSVGASATQAVPAPSAASATAPGRGGECRPSGPPVMLATDAEPDITPTFAWLPRTQRLAIGYASSRTEAAGITVDPRSLDEDRVFDNESAAPVVSVSPTTVDDRLSFSVTRTNQGLVSARGVDGRPPFTLGRLPHAVGARVAEEPTRSLWKLASTEFSVPAVATLSAEAHVVAFREGGPHGAIRVGWLTNDGQKRTELATLTLTAAELGTPAIAVSEPGALVAVAVRESPSAPWRLRLATSGRYLPPRTPVPLPASNVQPEDDTMAPAVAGARQGHWLLQWTEGQSGARKVYLATLDASLSLVGEPHLLSAAESNSGGGALWSNGVRAVSVFFKRVDGRHEVWAVSSECEAVGAD